MKPQAKTSSVFARPDPESFSRSARAFSKCLESLHSSSILDDQSISSTSNRNLYKSISHKSPDSFTQQDSFTSSKASPADDRSYQAQLRELEIRELKLQLREKDNEMLDLATQHQEELEAFKRQLLLEARKKELSLKEQIQATVAHASTEKNKLVHTITTLEEVVTQATPAALAEHVAHLQTILGKLEDEHRGLTEQNAALQTAQERYQAVAAQMLTVTQQLQDLLAMIFRQSESEPSPRLPEPEGDGLSQLSYVLTLLQEMNVGTNQHLADYLAYCQTTRPS